MLYKYCHTVLCREQGKSLYKCIYFSKIFPSTIGYILWCKTHSFRGLVVLLHQFTGKTNKQNKTPGWDRGRAHVWDWAGIRHAAYKAQPDLTTRPWNLDSDPELFNPAVDLKKPLHRLACWLKNINSLPTAFQILLVEPRIFLDSTEARKGWCPKKM